MSLKDISKIASESKKRNTILQEMVIILQQISDRVQAVEAKLGLIEVTLDKIADVLTKEPEPEPTDLALTFQEKENGMARVKVKMKAKGKGVKADMGTEHWSAASASGGLSFVETDASGNELPPPDVSAVTTTLNSDNAAVSVSKADELTYTLSKGAGVTGEANLAASITHNDGSVGPFTATLKLILDVAAAADLKIKFTPA